MQLYTRYTLDVPKGTISNGGIALILNLLESQNLKSEEWIKLNPDSTRLYIPDLPNDWSWEWTITGKGEYAGTFPKRVSKYYWQNHKLKCPQGLIQELGNIARQHSTGNNHFEFEFVDRFNWKSGDFGDKGSCYFGTHSTARDILQENDALAIRFYEGEKGYARAWIARLTENRYILFNGYGMPSNPTLTIARVFATWLGLNYKKIGLQNHGDTSGMLYINSGIGYLIGTPEQTADIEEYDLKYGCEACHECYSCERKITENEMYHAPNGENYCADCYYEVWSDCEHCGETHYREDMSYIDGTGEVCERCIDRHYSYCGRCYEYYANDEIIVIEGEYEYCHWHAEEIAIPCDNCGEWILAEHVTQTDNGIFCQDCRPTEETKE
jgi:hypothetical protein